MGTILVSGAISNKLYNGGAAWTRLSYVLGFRQLGWDTYFVEQIRPETCVDENGTPAAFQDSANALYFRTIMERFGLQAQAALVEPTSLETEGLSYSDLVEAAHSAELLVNISGHLTVDALKSGPRRKAYLDLDPGFTQLWSSSGNSGARLDGHDRYFTVGENIGLPGCSITTCGLNWQSTRPPVVLDLWPSTESADPARFTTVASWRGPYGPVEYNGKTLGSKVQQFRKYVSIPSHSSCTFEIALDIHPGDAKDRDLLGKNRWTLADPKQVAGDPFAFRDYVQGSGAEFSVAQQIYVETKSGWFSDRTVRYLASGKPVLIEDTGIQSRYPVGSGLLTFSSLEEAAQAAEEIQRDYPTHARSARHIAETFFDSHIVLSELLERAGI